VQLPGLEGVELVKFTLPVKPPTGVTVIVDVAVCPAGTLRAAGLGDNVNGTVTLTTAGVTEVDGLLVPLPS